MGEERREAEQLPVLKPSLAGVAQFEHRAAERQFKIQDLKTKGT
jgi:hypothetical protein